MTAEIIGLAAVAPGARTAEELFSLLDEGRCTVSEIPDDRWDKARYWHPSIGTRGKTYTFAAGVLDDCYAFDPAVFGMSRPEALLLDPQQRVILQLVWQALEDANIDYADLSEERVGVYIGASGLDHGNLIVEDPAAGNPYFMTGNTLSIVSNRISHVFSLHGPSLTVDTACSSSLVALDLAFKALEAGEIDLAVVGGVSVLVHPLSFVGFAQARMLSPEGLCRAYDDNGAGYVRAEGGAVVILRRSDAAQRLGDRSHARLVASGVNSAGRTNGISLPSCDAQLQLLASIYDRGGIDPDDLAFIEGHGTGTKVGDPAELASIGEAIGKRRRAPIAIGSIKTNIGHAEPASGLLGLIKAVMALKHNRLPASLHFETPNRSVDFDALNVRVAAEPVDLLAGRRRPRLAGVNSFGFGGTNAHAVIGDPAFPPATPQLAGASGQTFMASAHTEAALRALVRDYAERLDNAPADDRRKIVAASGVNRHPMRHRLVVNDRDAKAIARDLRAYGNGKAPVRAEIAEAAQGTVKTAFVFSGNGSQWAGMGLAAYRQNVAFRKHFDILHALFEVQSGIRLNELLADEALSEKLADTRIAQPLLFATQAALVDVLVEMGIRPSVVFGHSVGEVAAAYASGALTLVDAVAVVARRSAHQHALADRGGMAAATMSAEDAAALCRRHGLNGLCVAAENAANSITMSGEAGEIALFRQHARAARIAAQVLDIGYPFHHPLIEKAKSGFLEDLTELSLHRGELCFISAVTGSVLEGHALDADYWWRNVREPVLFRRATEAALDLDCGLFVEIGPRPILASYLRETLRARSSPARIVASLKREEDDSDADPVAAVFSRIVAHGGAFERGRVFGQRQPNTKLPGLPFDRQDIRQEFTSDAIDLYGRHGIPFTLAGWRTDPRGGSWKNHVDAHLYPDLAEHVVDGRSILPGTGFLEIALSAARQFFGDDRIEIEGMELMRSLELSRETLSELSTVISPETGAIEIRSRERLGEDEWMLHARARARRLKMDAPAAAPKTAVRSGSAVIEGALAYATAARFRLDYGPKFRLLRRAVRHGDSQIDVVLEASAKPAHPYLAYTLDPVSVDVAFHGLIAALGGAAHDDEDVPFIPVRFGRLRLYAAGQAIERASIVVRRSSGRSVRADFTLFGSSGEIVATLTDCRFKRTYLRRPRRLDEVAYHQALVASPRVRAGEAPAGPSVFAGLSPKEPDSSQQMLEAAVYRACYDIGRRLQGETAAVSADDLPGDKPFRQFLANCLHVAEEAGLAEHDGHGWSLAADCALPAVSAILIEVGRERPDRAIEVVAVNAVFREALARIEALDARMRHIVDEDAPGEPLLSEATIQHLSEHSAPARMRHGLARQALDDALRATVGGHAPRVVEIGAVSRTLTSDLAGAALRAGGCFAVIEPSEARRRELAAVFRDEPRVTIADPSADLPAADIIISAADDLYGLMRSGSEMREAVKKLAARDTRLILCMAAPSPLVDFTMGLTGNWFGRSQSVEFPIGAMASAADWKALAGALGMEAPEPLLHESSYGGVICLDGRSGKTGVVEDRPRRPLLVLHDAAEILECGGENAVAAIGLSGDLDVNREKLSGILAETGNAPHDIVYLCGPAGIEEGSELLVKETLRLGSVAQALDGAGLGGKMALAVVLRAPEGGNRACVAGLQAFLRVLRNEFPELDLHTIDLSASPYQSAAACIAEAAEIVARASGNREWVADGATGAMMEARAVAGAFRSGSTGTSAFEAATVRQQVPSQVGSIVWESAGRRPPASDEVVIEVAAAGLNFRDVMWAMGMLPEEALEDGFAGATIGMECAGRIVALGGAVEGFAVGDRVMAIAPAAFSTHVSVPSFAVCRLPSGMEIAAGATLPVAFVTAWYALVELARIQPGETVLIHGGAGGVGLAALQIAKARGAKVIATAGNVEKRRYLTLNGADHVFDSRSLAFVDGVLAVTRHEGVDIVLNSLFSEAMERSLSLVRPFGRFLELGKRDFYGDTKLGLRPFRRNVSYFGIDADQLLSGRPELARRLLADIAALFERGDLTPLPYRVFRHDEIADAFRLMQGSGHIGKIVVTPPVAGRDSVTVAARPDHPADPEGVHLVVGGIGGFGLAAADWLVGKGARRIALCSRRGGADEETSAALERWAAAGVTATLHACDVTDEAAVAALLAELRREAPLKSVLHAAMVLDDALIANLTAERNRPVIETKAKGASILDRLTRGDKLDLFLLFSSATTLIGNPGQSNYVAANGYLEGLARARRAAGLPALAVGFGAIADVGFLRRNGDVGDALARRIGRTAMTAREAFRFLDAYMARDPGTVDAAAFVLAEIDWAAAEQLATVRSPLLTAVARAGRKHAAAGDGQPVDLRELIAGKPPEEGERAVFDLVAAEIAAVLKVSVGEVTPTRIIRDIGLDSLMAMELGMNFRQRTGMEIPLSSVTQATTVADIAHKLYLRVARQEETSGDAAELLDELAGRHAEERGAASA